MSVASAFINISASKDCYKYSFFSRTIVDWNRFPPHVHIDLFCRLIQEIVTGPPAANSNSRIIVPFYSCMSHIPSRSCVSTFRFILLCCHGMDGLEYEWSKIQIVHPWVRRVQGRRYEIITMEVIMTEVIMTSCAHNSPNDPGYE